MIAAPFNLYAGGVSNFNALTSAAAYRYDPADGQKIFKSMANMHVPLANNPTGGVPTLLAITSPTCIFDIQDNDIDGTWRNVMIYSRPEMALRYEVGMWQSIRYIQTVRNTLLNCGAVAAQTTMAAASAGDGAYGTVDSAYTVGQSGATAYVTLASVTGLNVGDVVTIHNTRTRTYGALDGVNPTEGTVRNRRIIDITGLRVAFDKPLLDDFSGTTYLTSGTDIHMTSFLGGPCLAVGVGQPPQVYAPPAVDDMQAIQRFTWDTYSRYQLYRPEFGANIYSGGSSFLEYQFN